MIDADASPEEAAAIVAALEQLMRATAPTQSAADEATANSGDPWLTEAILEGVAREPLRGHGDDASHPWINT